ncbi:MAG: ATP-binding protein [Pseudomonadota bacterium]
MMHDFAHHVAMRSAEFGETFERSAIAEAHANDAMARRFSMWKAADDLDAAFDKRFQSQPDGTYRSRNEDFEGARDGGGVTYGVAAFIAPSSVTESRHKAALLAAYDVVARYGDAFHYWAEDFYFYTPNNDIIIFAPERSDRLLFYRKEAPADLSFQKTLGKYVSIKNNPDRGMKCSGLVGLMYDAGVPRIGASCHTPFDADGRHVGAFGISYWLAAWLEGIVEEPVYGVSPMIVAGDGEMIAHADMNDRSGGRDAGVAFARAVGADELIDEISRRGDEEGWFYFPPWRSYVAYARMTGPDWYLLAATPASAVQMHVLGESLGLGVLSLCALLAVIAGMTLTVRRLIKLPLVQLAREAAFRVDDAVDVGYSAAGRSDEIGELARSFQSRDDRYRRLVANLDAKVKARTSELEKARDEAERANAAKSAFLANMSHEIRTPLNGVIGMAQVLSRSRLEPQQKEYADVIARSGASLLGVINDVLDLSKIEAGSLRIERAPFDLSNLLSDLEKEFRHMTDEKGLGLYFELRLGGAEMLEGDMMKVRQVLTNLLSNAIKFTAEGHIDLVAEAARGSGEEVMTRFTVRDTGIGITEEALSRVFEPFEQADVSTTRRYGGTGLGLPICRRIAQAMGGGVSATSAPGRGSAFVFWAPMRLVERRDDAA